MKKNLLIPIFSLLLLGFFVLAAAQEKAYKSQLISEPRQIDGQANDWEGASFVNFKKANVDYALAHDDEHLYIVMIFNDRESLSTAEQTGVFIYFSQAGKKNKDYGYHFIRKIISADEAIARMESYGELLSEERKAQIREKKMFAIYVGEPVGKQFLADLQKIKGQKFEPAVFRSQVPQSRRAPGAAARQSGGFQKAVFEFRIPLRPSPALPPLLEPGRPINLGVEWGGMTEEMKKNLMARRAEEATRTTGTDSRAGESEEGSTEGGIDRRAGELRFREIPRKFNFWFGLILPAR